MGQDSLHVLQAHTFYDVYLTKFFASRPGLSDAPYEVQLNELINDGFATAHLTAAFLKDYGFKSTIAIANCELLQKKWANDHGITLSYPHEYQKQILRKQIEYYKPDILYLTDPITFQSDFIYSLDFRPKLIITWRAGPIPQGTSWSGYDILLSNISGIRTTAPKLGVKHCAYQAPGIPNDLKTKTSNVQSTADVVFSGQVGWGHIRRGEYINFLAKQASESSPKFTCNLHISGDYKYLSPEATALNKGPLFGLEYFSSLKSGDICIDVRGDSVGLVDSTTNQTVDLAKGEGGSMRLFEATGCGAFLMCEEFENLSEYFEPNEEIVTFKDEKDLLEKILYFKAHPDKRAEIAQRGYERCMRDHSIDIHVRRFIDIVNHYLPKEEHSLSNSLINSKIQSAVTYLNSNEAFSALETISEVITTGHNIPETHYIRGICFLQLQKVFEAINDLEMELRISPQRSDVQELLNTIRSSLGIV